MSLGRVATLFRLAFGRDAAVVSSAPGRVNLIGEHTDYNGGEVLPIAITQRTWVAMGHSSAELSRAVSGERGEIGEFKPGEKQPSGKWYDYVAGSLLESRSLGVRDRPKDIAVVSDVPMGSGLSSSAALEVATVLAALALDGCDANIRDAALAAHRAETGYVGVASGVMDQFASALGVRDQALHLRCDTLATSLVPFGRSVLIVDTATPRELRGSAYNVRRAECEAALTILRTLDPSLVHLARATPELLERASLPAPLAARARHVVSETRRVGAFVDALRVGRPVSDLLDESHRSLRDDYECSTRELDWVVEFARDHAEVEGARLTGAGWGGCAIVVGDERGLRDLAPPLEVAFTAAFERAPHTWLTGAEDGARVEHKSPAI